ncbi:OmpA family protein [bacterium]|nr:OmpA family protein [bacterium]
MKIIKYVIILILLFSMLATAEESEQKFSVSIGSGLFGQAAEWSYRAIGNSFFAQAKYGVVGDLELGFAGGFGYSYPATNIAEYPYPTRDSEDPSQVFDYWDWRHGSPYREPGNKGVKISFDENTDLRQKLVVKPFELFFHFRSLSQSIVNPYATGGFGLTYWKMVDKDDGNLLEVRDAEVERWSGGVLDTIQVPGYSNEWVEYKGKMFHIMGGFGVEFFPIENVGIDLGLRGRYLFGDDVSNAYLDSIEFYGEAFTRITFYYGGIKDTDRDGVPDKRDECPDTPFGAIVDEFGCPLDSDNDGVFDGIDQCPNTRLRAIVDAIGCPLDTDEDAVYDGIDQCPKTPIGVKVDTLGCPLESDGDGVVDFKDLCPNTPIGAIVDSSGCPFDTDDDGVYDGIDLCPNTQPGIEVNDLGCPKEKMDSDGDGIADEFDKCPHTPRGALVDSSGCPLDSDNDNVYNGLDKCPKTPEKALVDSFGCPLDTDGDMVYDGIDECPNTPKGVEVDEVGCPKAKKLEKGESIRVKVYFESCKWNITKKAAEDLHEALQILKAYPEMRILIEGHTDNRTPTGECKRLVGDNTELSIRRALSVKEWLIDQGIAGMRLETIGYGETRPVDTNNSSDGRANNRRIEFRRIE